MGLSRERLDEGGSNMDGLRTFVTDTVTDAVTTVVDPSDVFVKNGTVDATISFGRRGGLVVDFGPFQVWNCVNGNFSVSLKGVRKSLSPSGTWVHDHLEKAQFESIWRAFWHAVHAGAMCFDCLGAGKFTTHCRSGSDIPNQTGTHICGSCGGRGAPGAMPRAAKLSTLNTQLSTFQATA